jgi:hypothetical protein
LFDLLAGVQKRFAHAFRGDSGQPCPSSSRERGHDVPKDLLVRL